MTYAHISAPLFCPGQDAMFNLLNLREQNLGSLCGPHLKGSQLLVDDANYEGPGKDEISG